MSYEPENPSSDLSQNAQAWLAREFGAIREELNRKTTAGFTAMWLDSAVASSNVITPVPVKIEGFNRASSEQLGATVSLGDSTFSFNTIGHWVVGCQVVFEVVESTANDTREVYLDFYNENDGVSVATIATDSIPRYGSSVTLSGGLLSEIGADNINKKYALYIYSPSGHTITLTSIQVLDLYVHRVSVET